MKTRILRTVILFLIIAMMATFATSCFNDDGKLDDDIGTESGGNNGIDESIKYKITFYTSNNDSYLQGVVGTTKVEEYSLAKKVTLSDLVVPGYYFKGWYTSQVGGEKVSKINEGEGEDMTLYAQWEKIEYTITFDSPDVPMPSITYTVDKGATLTNAEWYGYTFVGWSTDDGFLVTSFKPGTTGNITLHANWTSNRNKATSYSNYGDPIIIEDADNGTFLFVYNIGRIDNVPLSVIENIGNTQRLEYEKSVTISNYIDSQRAEIMLQSIMNATTRSSGWTLSEEWNNVFSEGTETGKIQGKTDERIDSQGNVVGGNYFISNSTSGSSYVSNQCGGSDATSSKVTTDKSFGINASYDASTSMYSDAKLTAENKTEAGVSAGISYGPAKAEASLKNTTTVGSELSSGRKDDFAFHIDGSYSTYTGTVDTEDHSSYWDTTTVDSASWNSTSSYSQSYQTSTNSTVSSAISEQISQKSNYNISESIGGENSKNEQIAGTESAQQEYSSEIWYSEGTTETYQKTLKFYSDRPGYYRIIMAGTVHVYAVVGYDVATSSYFTYTFNVLDDERHEYLDYSKDNANFNDCENGVVTFEVPYDVNEYIMGLTGKTDGLVYDNNGHVVEFNTPNNFNGDVVIPQYYSKNNFDGTYDACKTTSFNFDTFRFNTSVETVVLPVYVTEIPANAFEGCTNLKTVVAFGVTKIGENAFKGCTSLRTFEVDSYVSYIGANAFEGVNEIQVVAANASVAQAAIESGAKRITLDITRMSDSFSNRNIVINENTEFFKFIGGGKTLDNTQIISDAKETFISNTTFKNNTSTPVRTSSETLTLARVTIENAPGFALVLTADNAVVYLYETNKISTVNQNVMVSKNVSFERLDASAYGVLEISGIYSVNGSISNIKYVNSAINPVYIDDATFNGFTKAHSVYFDANGGTGDTTKEVYYGQYYGKFPIPTRYNYTFGGWYTSKDGGTQVTEDNVALITSNQILYAHWTYNSYVLSFDANGGNVLTSYKIVTYNQQIGTLPTPTRDHYNFLGWFDQNGNRVTENSVYSVNKDSTLTARWEIKPVQGWIKVEDLPEGAEIVDTKWTYSETQSMESTNANESGWNVVGSYWEESGSGSAEYASFPDTFLESHEYYKNMNKSAFEAYENETSKREVVNTWTGYIYWHYMYSTSASAYYRCIRDDAGTATNYNNYVYKDSYFRAFKDTKSYEKLGKYYDFGSGTTLVSCGTKGYATYLAKYGKSNSETSGSCFWYRFDYYTSTYTDYVKVFQYERTLSGESDTIVLEGNKISNVQQWVQYREK